MDSKTRALCYINAWIPTVIFATTITTLLLIKESVSTNDIMNASLFTISCAVISSFVSYIIARKNKTDKKTDAINKLANELTNATESLAYQIGTSDRSLSNMIGVRDQHSLAKQHESISKLIESAVIPPLSQIAKQSEIDQRNYEALSESQQKIHESVSNIVALSNDWQRLNFENAQQRETITALQGQVELLEHQLEASRNNPGPIITPPTGRSR